MSAEGETAELKPSLTVQKVVKTHQSFAAKHPKVWKQYRKVRKVAICLAPIVSFAGSTAQFLSYVVPKR